MWLTRRRLTSQVSEVRGWLRGAFKDPAVNSDTRDSKQNSAVCIISIFVEPWSQHSCYWLSIKHPQHLILTLTVSQTYKSGYVYYIPSQNPTSYLLVQEKVAELCCLRKTIKSDDHSCESLIKKSACKIAFLLKPMHLRLCYHHNMDHSRSPLKDFVNGEHHFYF